MWIQDTLKHWFSFGHLWDNNLSALNRFASHVGFSSHFGFGWYPSTLNFGPYPLILKMLYLGQFLSYWMGFTTKLVRTSAEIDGYSHQWPQPRMARCDIIWWQFGLTLINATYFYYNHPPHSNRLLKWIL